MGSLSVELLYLGTCNYVKCEEGQWSKWSSDCGKGTRVRPINVIKQTIEKYSCAGLNQKCKEEDVEEREQLCKFKLTQTENIRSVIQGYSSPFP